MCYALCDPYILNDHIIITRHMRICLYYLHTYYFFAVRCSERYCFYASAILPIHPWALCDIHIIIIRECCCSIQNECYMLLLFLESRVRKSKIRAKREENLIRYECRNSKEQKRAEEIYDMRSESRVQNDLREKSRGDMRQRYDILTDLYI